MENKKIVATLSVESKQCVCRPREKVCKMPKPPEKERPHPKERLSKSTFTLCQDESVTKAKLKQSVFKTDYPAWGSHHRRPDVHVRNPAPLFHQDLRKLYNRTSETTKSYPPKSQPKVFKDTHKFKATNIKMDKDLSKYNEYATSHGTDFPVYNVSRRKQLDPNPMRSSIPNGDKEKAPKPISDYKDRFDGHDPRLAKPAKSSNKYQVSDPISNDDRLHDFQTTTSQQFTGSYLPKVRPPSKSAGTNVPRGDLEKEFTNSTTHRDSYLPQVSKKQSYNKEETMEKLQETHFILKDNHGTFDTYISNTRDSFQPVFNPALIKVTMDRNRSDFPDVDDDPPRGLTRFNTTNNFHYSNPIIAPAQIVNGAKLITRSNVSFGDPAKSEDFYSTTTGETYRPTDTKYKSHKRQNLSNRSIIPVKYYGDEIHLPTMINDYKNPCQSRITLDENALSSIRDSHIQPPIAGRYFTTEHQDQYIPKETSRALIDAGRLQRSNLPLGTFSAPVPIRTEICCY